MSKIEREPKGGEFLPTRRAEWKNPILVATNFALDLSRRLGIIGKNGEFLDPERFQRLCQGCLVIACSMWDERGQPVTPWRVAVESLQQEGVINPGNRRIDRFSLAQLKLVEERIGDLGQEMIGDFLSDERTLRLASQLRLAGEPLAVFSRGMYQGVDSFLRTAEEKIKPLKEYLKAHPQVRRAVLGAGSGLVAFLLIASFAPKRTVASSPSPDNNDSKPITHPVQPGETLSRIADYYGLSIKEILDANPQIRNPNLIRTSQILNIPLRGARTRTFNEPHPYVDLQHKYVYRVRYGDTLLKIARKFGKTVDEILRVNQIPDPDKIFEGQQITIPGVVVGFSCTVTKFARLDCQGPRIGESKQYEPYNISGRCLNYGNNSVLYTCESCPTGVDPRTGRCLDNLEKVPKR